MTTPIQRTEPWNDPRRWVVEAALRRAAAFIEVNGRALEEAGARLDDAEEIAAELRRALACLAGVEAAPVDGRKYMEECGPSAGPCACGRVPDPGVKPQGGCWCVEGDGEDS